MRVFCTSLFPFKTKPSGPNILTGFLIGRPQFGYYYLIGKMAKLTNLLYHSKEYFAMEVCGCVITIEILNPESEKQAAHQTEAFVKYLFNKASFEFLLSLI
jgi:hypothetical protein